MLQSMPSLAKPAICTSSLVPPHTQLTREIRFSNSFYTAWDS